MCVQRPNCHVVSHWFPCEATGMGDSCTNGVPSFASESFFLYF